MSALYAVAAVILIIGGAGSAYINGPKWTKTEFAFFLLGAGWQIALMIIAAVLL